MKFLIDSGSVVSLVPKNSDHTKPADLVLYAANGTVIRTFGEKALTLDLGLRRSFNWTFIVADVKNAIIGADFIINFKLLIDLHGKRLLDPLTSLKADGVLHEASVYGISTVDKFNVPEGPVGAAYNALLHRHIELTKPNGVPFVGKKSARLTMDGQTIFCDVAAGVVRPYLPKSLRRAAFDVVHGSAHPNLINPQAPVQDLPQPPSTQQQKRQVTFSHPAHSDQFARGGVAVAPSQLAPAPAQAAEELSGRRRPRKQVLCPRSDEAPPSASATSRCG
ncbi:hypothetical protein QAD02_020722 [Eretmocerus hayati]|uniref:Uncharacterized protein n=1 Tax=Eretmocerus hayati TaxID=131215 RepID=A0ACC2PNP0_9HYME|nr:hypothetical protein QAD02_020722 [Eretmocerus hayati]